jgi:hypothetical protein
MRIAAAASCSAMWSTFRVCRKRAATSSQKARRLAFVAGLMPRGRWRVGGFNFGVVGIYSGMAPAPVRCVKSRPAVCAVGRGAFGGAEGSS